MATRSSFKLKTGPVIGLIVLILVLIGGGVGLFLSTTNTDSRSQASADHVARVSISPRTVSVQGLTAQHIGIDISQMKSGTSVTSFKSTLAVERRKKVLGDTTLESEGLVAQPCKSDKECGPDSTCYRPPTECPKGQVCATQMPYCVPSRPSHEPRPTRVAVTLAPPRPTRMEPTSSPGSTVLAKSSDGLVTVLGINAYKEIKLQVSVETIGETYEIKIEGLVSPDNKTLQTAFMKNTPILTVTMNEKPIAFGQIFVKEASIKGYLPGLKTIVELTQPTKPTRGPTPPPRVTNVPTMTRVTPTDFPSKPTPFPSKRPPYPSVNVSNRPTPHVSVIVPTIWKDPQP